MLKHFLFMAMLIVAFTGCRKATLPQGRDYQTIRPDPNRDTQEARRRNAAAVQLLSEGQLEPAEKELKAALAADLFFGPAHNNLGIVYHREKKYYLAAWEFQYAAKLMPNSSEPRNNLGLVFEAVGRLDEAAEWYDKALALAPESSEIIGNLARVRLRANHKDERTRNLLNELVLKDDRPEWVDWARRQLALMGPPQDSQAE